MGGQIDRYIDRQMGGQTARQVVSLMLGQHFSASAVLTRGGWASL